MSRKGIYQAITKKVVIQLQGKTADFIKALTQTMSPQTTPPISEFLATKTFILNCFHSLTNFPKVNFLQCKKNPHILINTITFVLDATSISFGGVFLVNDKLLNFNTTCT